MNPFVERLSRLCPFDLGRGFLTLVEALYARPQGCYCGVRAYHNLHHLVEMAEAFAAVQRDVGWQKPNEAFAALLFHDAVYVVGQSDNEERSAELARCLLPTLLSPKVGEGFDWAHTVRLIQRTAEYGKIKRDGLDSDTQHFLDCDLSSLGAERDRFLDTGTDIRSEFLTVFPKEAYAAGRRAFLEQLLEPNHRIFLSDYFHARLEDRARANLQAALAML